MPPRSYSEFARSIIETLEALQITYAIGGSFASSTFGEARSTLDIDISLVLPLSEATRLVEAIQKLGYYVFLDAILDAAIWSTPFNVIDSESGYKADVFLFQPTPLEQSVLEHRRRVVYDEKTGASAMLYSPEDAIIYKLKYYLEGQMEKHPRDIAAMLLVQGDELDYEYITHWASEIGALDVWSELLAEYRRRVGKDK